MSLGRRDGRLEGDMGLSQDGPIGASSRRFPNSMGCDSAINGGPRSRRPPAFAWMSELPTDGGFPGRSATRASESSHPDLARGWHSTCSIAQRRPISRSISCASDPSRGLPSRSAPSRSSSPSADLHTRTKTRGGAASGYAYSISLDSGSTPDCNPLQKALGAVAIPRTLSSPWQS